MKIFISKYYHDDGGSIFIKKIAQHLNADIVCMNDEFIFVNMYIYFLDSKVGKFISRLPYYEKVIGSVITNIFLYLYTDKILKIVGKHSVMIPSDKFFLYRLFNSLEQLDIHFICLDLPWTFKNSKKNNEYIKLKTLLGIARFKTVNVCTELMKQELDIINNPLVFVTYSSFDIYQANNVQSVDNTLEQRRVNYPLKLVFVGNPRFRGALIHMLDTLDNLNVAYTLDIYSSKEIYDQRVKNCGFVTSDELMNLINRYDFGVVPLSYSQSDSVLVKTSFPSKTFSYLSAGLPVLAVAPEYSGLCRVMKGYNIGLHLEDITRVNSYDLNVGEFVVDICQIWADYFQQIKDGVSE